MYVAGYGFLALIVLFALASFLPITGFITNILLVIAVLGVIIVVMRNVNLSKRNFNKYDEKLMIIQNVQRGGVIRIHNVEGQSYDLDLKVVNKNLYMEGDYSWYELECVNSNGEKFWIDVDDDDELVVSIVIEKLRPIDVKESASYSDIDDNESGNVVYKGKIFNYEDSAEAIFYKHCDDKNPEQLYYWDFKNGNRMVSVERWGQKFEYFYSQIIKPSDIEIYRTKGEVK